MPKAALIILDGLGDRPKTVLGGLTPLEAARTPNQDRLVTDGMCGMVDPIHPGVPVDTHTGTAALMGLSQAAVRELRRGPVEAAGVGLAIRPGDVALRCNFAHVERAPDGWRILDRRAGRIREGTAELCAALEGIELGGGITATLRPATDHRAVLQLVGPHLSADIGDTDPGSGVQPAWVGQCHATDAADGDAARTAKAVNTFLAEARERLRDHPLNRARVARGLPPANGVISRGAGQFLGLDCLPAHLGLHTAVVAGERTVLGLGSLLGFTLCTEPGFTASTETDLARKLQAAQDALEEHDLVYVHVKAPDICSHDRDPWGKRDFLERFDAEFAALFEAPLVVAVTADHSTDSLLGRHIGDPVPTLLRAPSGRRDACRRFGEADCLVGGLGRLPASGLLTSVLDAMEALRAYRASEGLSTFFGT